MEMEDKTMKQPELGQTILELRQRTGLTQSELAERCNMSLRTIQRIEAQEVTPRNYTIKTILSCLGYDPHEDTIGNDDSQDKDGNGMPRQKRLIKHIKELFNLKTNTMKKLLYYHCSYYSCLQVHFSEWKSAVSEDCRQVR